MLLQENPSIRHTAGVEAVYVVRTRGQIRQEEAEDAMQLQKEKESGVSTKMVDDVETTAETQLVGSEFDDDLFEENKPYLSRSQKRTEDRTWPSACSRSPTNQDPPLNKSEVRGIVGQ